MASFQAQFTREGYDRLKAELEELRSQRVTIREEIKEARELGDLKENAGYHAAKEQQGIMEARISSLESRLEDAIVVDNPTYDKVMLGVPVTVKMSGVEKPKIYTIVSSEELDYVENAASEASAIGQALPGKTEGDKIEIQGPKGPVTLEVLKIG